MPKHQKPKRRFNRTGSIAIAASLLFGGVGVMANGDVVFATENDGVTVETNQHDVYVKDWTWMRDRGGAAPTVPGGTGWTMTRHQVYMPAATTLGELATKTWKLDADNKNVQFQILKGTPILGTMTGFNFFPRDGVLEANESTIWMGKGGYDNQAKGKTLSQWAEEYGADTKVYVGLGGSDEKKTTLVESLTVGSDTYNFVQPAIEETSEDVYTTDWKWLKDSDRPGAPTEMFGGTGWELTSHQGYSATTMKLGALAGVGVKPPSRVTDDDLVLQILVGKILGNRMLGYNLFPAGNPAETTADTKWVHSKDQRELTLAQWIQELGADTDVYVGIAGLKDTTEARTASSASFGNHTFNFAQRAEIGDAEALSMEFEDSDIWVMPGKTNTDMLTVTFDKVLNGADHYRWEITDESGKVVASGNFDGVESKTTDEGEEYSVPVDLPAGKFQAFLYSSDQSEPVLTSKFVNVEPIEHVSVLFDRSKITIRKGETAEVNIIQVFSHDLHDQEGYMWQVNAVTNDDTPTQNRASSTVATGTFLGIKPKITDLGAELTLPNLALPEGKYEAAITYEGQVVGTSNRLTIQVEEEELTGGEGVAGGNTESGKKPAGSLANTGATWGGFTLLALATLTAGLVLKVRNTRNS